jgi:hypothetical protein
MAGPTGWRAALGGVLLALGLAGVVSLVVEMRFRDSPRATNHTARRWTVSEVSLNGQAAANAAPLAIQIAAAKATGLFVDTRWDEFVAWADVSGPRYWLVKIEPKSGGPEDTLWFRIDDDELKSFGFRHGKKLRGYRGKRKHK